MFHESVLQGSKLMLTSSDTLAGIRRQKLFKFNTVSFQKNQCELYNQIVPLSSKLVKE